MVESKRGCKTGVIDPFKLAFLPIDSLRCELLIGANAGSSDQFLATLLCICDSVLAEIRPTNFGVGRNSASRKPKFGIKKAEIRHQKSRNSAK